MVDDDDSKSLSLNIAPFGKMIVSDINNEEVKYLYISYTTLYPSTENKQYDAHYFGVRKPFRQTNRTHKFNSP